MDKMEGYFVTGTGTEVGKTVVAAVLARTAAGERKTVAVFKPAVSGLDEGGEPDYEILRRASGSPKSDDEIAPYRYGPAVSPHLAAEMAGEEIDPQELVAAADAARDSADVLICEGTGGFLVPLGPRYLVRNLARHLGLPVVVVANPELGTINHTLLTVEAVRIAGLRVAGVVLTPWAEKPGKLELSNRDTIERLGEVAVHTLPELDLAKPEGWPSLAP